MSRRVLGLNVGHDACIAVFENGQCTHYEDLARTFRVKHLALRSGRAAERNPYWQVATDIVRGLEPDAIAATLNPGDLDEFTAQLAMLEQLPEFGGSAKSNALAWDALHHRGVFRVGPRAYLVEHGLAHVYSAYVTSDFPREARVLGVALDGWSTFGHDTVVELTRGDHGLIRRGDFAIGGSFFDQYLSTLLFGKPDLGAPGKIMGFAQLGRTRTEYRDYLETTLRLFATRAATFRELEVAMASWARHTLAEFPELSCSDPDFESRSGVQDFFATAQDFFTDATARRIAALADDSPCSGVVYAGGCALSIVTNDRLARALRVPLHIVPCADDSGQAFGAAAWLDIQFGGPSPPVSRFDPFLGSQAGGDREPSSPALLDVESLAEKLTGGALLGWFRGRHAVGPRALGDRSVLASPAIAGMRDRLNRDVKHREWYRPYGAICLESEAAQIFEEGRPSPYMLYSFRVREAFRASTRECCSDSGWCRVQTVNDVSHPDLSGVLRAFTRRTGCPLLINTSLNCGGLPIVSSLEHAIRDATEMALDGLVWVDTPGVAAEFLKLSADDR